jgi:hypothetical protein
VIVELGFADRPTVEHAVRAARSPGTTVAQVLLQTGAVSEEQLAQAVAERHGLPYVDLGTYEVDAAAANLLAPSVARRYRCVPVGFAGSQLVLATTDPADALGVAEVASLLGREVVPVVATESAIDQLTGRLPLDAPAAELAPAPDEEAVPGELDGERELIELRLRVEAAEAAAEDARRRAASAEAEAARARARADELEGADRRAEQARLALAELREEGERDRELRALEVQDAIANAERAVDELREAHRRMCGSAEDG